jgi:phosphoheptose isomerase
MDYYNLIATSFQSTIETIAMSVDDLAGPIESGSELLANALLNDHKIISCGNGVDATLAQQFANNLLSRFEHDRPALPALALGGDGSTLTAIVQSNGINDIFSRQIRALGQQGDILLCINSTRNSPGLLRAIQAAHERNMQVVALSNSGDSEMSTLMGMEDVGITVAAPSQARTVELHTMTLNSLCELIEHRLFGGYNQE